MVPYSDLYLVLLESKISPYIPGVCVCVYKAFASIERSGSYISAAFCRAKKVRHRAKKTTESIHWMMNTEQAIQMWKICDKNDKRGSMKIYTYSLILYAHKLSMQYQTYFMVKSVGLVVTYIRYLLEIVH